MEDNMKLFVKTTCYVCNRKRYNCPSCHDGWVYTEASDNSVLFWLLEQDESTQEKIFSALKKAFTNSAN